VGSFSDEGLHLLAATAMIDRLIHHSEILSTKGTEAHIA
jgi:hypothetical protein